jgi:hypothetical protein
MEGILAINSLSVLKILDCAGKVANESEMIWVLLGCLSRGIPPTIQFQLQTNQHIPFWTSYTSPQSFPMDAMKHDNV